MKLTFETMSYPSILNITMQVFCINNTKRDTSKIVLIMSHNIFYVKTCCTSWWDLIWRCLCPWVAEKENFGPQWFFAKIVIIMATVTLVFFTCIANVINTFVSYEYNTVYCNATQGNFFKYQFSTLTWYFDFSLVL